MGPRMLRTCIPGGGGGAETGWEGTAFRVALHRWPGGQMGPPRTASSPPLQPRPLAPGKAALELGPDGHYSDRQTDRQTDPKGRRRSAQGQPQARKAQHTGPTSSVANRKGKRRGSGSG